MGQKLEKMVQQQRHHPKDELLYHSAIAGDLEAIKSLRRDGAALEWIDSEGKTALIVACMNPGLLDVAKTLIEMGADINAYRPGRNAGTPLHHASKRGLEQTVKLLLSHGANALVRNDDCQTPLDVARSKGYTLAVRAIESHICYFSGWLREFYGPGFLGGFLAPQLLSRKIWVVIVPWGAGNAVKHPKFELAIYSTFQDALPRTVIALWKAKIEAPKFHKSDPAVIVFDESTKTRFKLASGAEGDKEQLQWLYSACKGINLVMPCSTPHDAQTSTASATHHQGSDQAKDENGWGNPKPVENHNGWGTPVVSARPESSSSGWIDGVPKEDDDNWGLPNSKQAGKQSRGISPAHDQESKKDYGGWSLLDSKPEGSSKPNQSVESSSTGWLDEAPKDEYNGWGVLDSRPVGSKSERVKTTAIDSPAVHGSSSDFIHHPVSTVPSAPPIPDGGMEEGPIRYLSLDVDPVSLSIDPGVTQYRASSTTAGDGDGGSSSCIICWEGPIEGACIPCGHMAGCMSCLNEIKAKKGDCPVCRSNINQVIKLFAV